MKFAEGILFFVLGLVAGSFANVLIYRLPRGISVVRPGSRCPHCKRSVKWYENIPVCSYVFLRGRCSGCGKRISPRYPLVELACGLLFLLVWTKFGLSVTAFRFFVLVVILVAATFIDLEHQVIPDELSLGGILLGWSLSVFDAGFPLVKSFLGALVGAGALYLLAEFYYWLRKREGLGGGDVKLLGTIGAFLGAEALIEVVVFAAVSGLVGAVISRRTSLRETLPFGPFLSVGALVSLFLDRNLVSVFSPIY